MSTCDRRPIHGAHDYVDHDGTDHRCPGRATDHGGSPTPLRDRILGPACPDCGIRARVDHLCARPAETVPVQLVHGRLLDGTVLCPDASLDPETPYATVFLDVVTCDTCAGRLARIQGRPTVHTEARPIRRARVLGVAR